MNKTYLALALLVSLFNGHSILSQSAHAVSNSIIEKAMAYPLTNVVNRYTAKTHCDDYKASEVERELKRFLALCALYPDQDFAMGSEIVDDLWHDFILFTHEYTDFCNQVAGKFMHHIPNIAEDNEEMVKSYHNFLEKYEVTFHEPAPLAIWPRLTGENKKAPTGRCRGGGCQAGNCTKH